MRRWGKILNCQFFAIQGSRVLKDCTSPKSHMWLSWSEVFFFFFWIFFSQQSEGDDVIEMWFFLVNHRVGFHSRCFINWESYCGKFWACLETVFENSFPFTWKRNTTINLLCSINQKTMWSQEHPFNCFIALLSWKPVWMLLSCQWYCWKICILGFHFGPDGKCQMITGAPFSSWC